MVLIPSISKKEFQKYWNLCQYNEFTIFLNLKFLLTTQFLSLQQAHRPPRKAHATLPAVFTVLTTLRKFGFFVDIVITLFLLIFSVDSSSALTTLSVLKSFAYLEPAFCSNALSKVYLTNLCITLNPRVLAACRITTFNTLSILH